MVSPSAMTGLPSFGKNSTIQLPSYIKSAVRRGNLQIQMPRIYEKGAVSLSWSAIDPNDDTLQYSLWMRKNKENKWTLISQHLMRNYFTIPAYVLPDGKYFFKVEVSDAPSNPGNGALTDNIISKLFIQDTTPPAIKVLSSKVTHQTLNISFEVKDSLSTIYRVEISKDGGNSWLGLLPEDGLNDEVSESYKINIPAPQNDVHLIIIRAMDYAGNMGSFSIYK